MAVASRFAKMSAHQAKLRAAAPASKLAPKARMAAITGAA
jgi:hypothetical protein